MKLLLLFIFITSCSNFNHRNPKSLKKDLYISKEQLEKIKPLEIIQILKDNVDNSGVIVFDQINTKNWTVEDMSKLDEYNGESFQVYPVMKVTSSVNCAQEALSTIDREIIHLKLAFKKGHYPLALCSTYDLEN